MRVIHLVISLRGLRKFLLFTCLFTLLTLLIAQLLFLFFPLFPMRAPYQEPYGNAVKVFVHQSNDPVYFSPKELTDRLRLFYWSGE